MLAGSTGAALVRVKRCAVYGSMGRLNAGLELLTGFEKEDLPERVWSVMLDTRVGLLVGLGRLEEARRLLEKLQIRPDEGGGIAGEFRRAELNILFGELDEAQARLGEVITRLATLEENGAGQAAARTLLAEVALLQGRDEEALALYDQVAESHSSAGRASASLRAEVGRVRVMVELGIQPLMNMLDRAVEFGESRCLTSFLITVLNARGMAWSMLDEELAARDFRRSAQLADEASMVLSAAAARYQYAKRLIRPGDRLEVLRAAKPHGAMSRPLRANLMLVEALLLVDSDPQESGRLARNSLTMLREMGMRKRIAVAKALVRSLD